MGIEGHFKLEKHGCFLKRTWIRVRDNNKFDDIRYWDDKPSKNKQQTLDTIVARIQGFMAAYEHNKTLEQLLQAALVAKGNRERQVDAVLKEFLAMADDTAEGKGSLELSIGRGFRNLFDSFTADEQPLKLKVERALAGCPVGQTI